MAQLGTITINKLPRSTKLIAKVRFSRGLVLRLWLGLQLIRLAALLVGVEFEEQSDVA